MKEKLKRFFIEKRELLLFMGVLLVVFTTVICVANYALSGEEKPVDPPVDGPVDDPTDDPTIDPTPENPVYKISVPVSGEYVVVRTFFDVESPVEELTKAVINTGSLMIESRGISYAKSDNSKFDVYTILPGKVIAITTDELEGTVITIEHENDIVSVYSSLESASVTLGQDVAENAKIGVAGTSILDNEAGIHVHLEITANEEYFNPSKVFGKQASEVSSTK